MLVEGVPDLFGKLDLLTEDSDSLVITDIKTSRGRWSQEQVEDSGEQLLLYSHLAPEIATRFLVLTKTKEPVIEEHVREVEPGDVKRTLAGYLGRELLSSAEHDELLVLRISRGVSGVVWVVSGGLEKERLRVTGPLFFAIRGRRGTGRWAGGYPSIYKKRSI